MGDVFKTMGRTGDYEHNVVMHGHGSAKANLKASLDPGNIFGLNDKNPYINPPAPAKPTLPASPPPPAKMPVPNDSQVQTQSEIDAAKRARLSGRLSTQNPGNVDSLG